MSTEHLEPPPAHEQDLSAEIAQVEQGLADGAAHGAPPPPDDDAALDAQLEQQAIVIPGDEKLVPLSAVTTVREQVRALKSELGAAKTSAERATQLEQQIQQLQAQLQQIAPKAQAYDAAVLAQQQTAPAAAPAEDTRELEALARDLDLYTTEGKPDLDKARRIQDRQLKIAESVAQRQVAPLAEQSLRQQAALNLARAKATEVNGLKPDPAILDALWSRLAAQPGGLKTLADPESCTHLWGQALAAHVTSRGVPAATSGAAARGPNGQFLPQTREPLPPPIFTEKAGGRDAGPGAMPLDDRERRVMSMLGMTEQEYLESAAKMPGGRR